VAGDVGPPLGWAGLGWLAACWDVMGRAGPPTRSQSWTYDGSRRRREETEGGAGVLEDGRVDDDDDDDTTMKKGKPGGGGGGGRENSGSRKAGGGGLGRWKQVCGRTGRPMMEEEWASQSIKSTGLTE